MASVEECAALARRPTLDEALRHPRFVLDVDPEVSNFGSQQISRFIDLAPYPPSRSFFFTINVSY